MAVFHPLEGFTAPTDPHALKYERLETGCIWQNYYFLAMGNRLRC